MPNDEQSEILRDFFDNAPVGLHWQSLDGTVKAANRALAAMLGCEPEELVGANFFRFLADRAKAAKLQERLARGETLNSEELVLRARDGSHRQVLYSASVLWENGEFVRARCFTRDIPFLADALQALAKADARKTALLDASLDAIITMDAQGRLLDFNQAAERMFGYTRQAAMQQQLSALIVPPRLRAAHEAGLRRYLETGSGPVLGKRIEIDAMRAGGEEFPVELSIAVVEGEPPLFTATLRDITERRRAEQVLRDTLAALQRSELALRDADRRKDEFIATLAHELRNPLAPIRTAAELLARPELAPERAAWATDIIRRQVSVMARLLDDLLDIARIVTNKLELRLEPARVVDTVELACDTVRPTLEAKGQHLHTELRIAESVVAVIDHVRIAQVLSNLLVNASKYSDPGRHVQLRGFLRHEALVFEVQDEGIGFEPELAPKLFDMFTQMPEAAGREQGGLGIGLALSLAVVRLHGGRIEAFSSGPGHGATFTVTLPLPAGEQAHL